ncbi:hypothetical protein B5M44_22040 [Shinella sumterensis]|uniref:hypothetical protein n=1 Tax=Shinella sumterensis TaxID=1967501 RepID=UPI00106E7BDD|nr:hypothetical protein [Shinella sumterensis]MCD1266899.1 hypothetical protein [Shinella sumterensis]TFE95219.1 hypothetical protein B5M44_22040 [Shinella sumterensis]
MVPMTMPRYVTYKRKKDGTLTFFWSCPTAFKKVGAPFASVTLGHDLPQAELNAAAAVWNERLDGWRAERSPMDQPVDLSRYGTIEWLVNAYLKHDSFLERVGEFSRPDYVRVFSRVCDETIKREMTGGDFRVGDMKISNVGVSTAEKIYKAFVDKSAARTAEKVVTYCKAMWKRMRPHHPDLFRQDTPNPWEGVTVKRRTKAVKGYADRETTYAFAEGAIALGRPELAAAAVLAFEWLMRPSSIGAGYASWGGYRGESAPDKIIIGHRKTAERAEHPLEYVGEDGDVIALYAEAEAILAKVPRYGLSIVCQKSGKLFGDGTRLSQDVKDIADRLAEKGKPVAGFTLDKARHGGMTELEERGLTEGQGRALSKHRTGTAYRGYAKETELRVLEATKKRMGISESAENISKINEPKTAKKD